MLSLSLSLAGLPRDDGPWGAGPRAAVAWAGGLGYRHVQLDATAPGIRARELDRSGRRDLSALLRRHNMGCSGLDLWVPPEHFAAPATAERAVAAALGAIELAADLGGLLGSVEARVVSLALPPEAADEVVGALSAAGESRGVRIADHAWPARATDAQSPIGVGLDPAVVIAAGEDAAAHAARLGRSLVSARLSDAGKTGRAAPGGAGGRLDLTAYAVALAVSGYGRPVVVDLRSLQDAAGAAAGALAAWAASTPG